MTNDPVAAIFGARAVNETVKAKIAQMEYVERTGRLMQGDQAGEYAMQFSQL